VEFVWVDEPHAVPAGRDRMRFINPDKLHRKSADSR